VAFAKHSSILMDSLEVAIVDEIGLIPRKDIMVGATETKYKSFFG
jgi:hypothetical protein